MNGTIVKALKERRLLTFGYKGKQRCAEPHTYGIRPDGREALCAWQREGGSGSDYRLFFVADMLSISIEDEVFVGPRENYRQGDSRFSRIYAEL